MDNNTETISIVMGVYNGEKTLPDCIESIVTQTYDKWEFVICDDASSDHTFDIIEEYKKKYPNKFTVLRNLQNKKLAESLNNCLSNARGQYVARMDADDISYPKRLEKQILFLRENQKIAAVGTGASPFDERGIKGIRLCPELPTKKDIVFGAPHIHPTVMFRKSVLDSLGGYSVDKKHYRCEDLDLWYRFYASGFKGYNLQEALLYYRETLSDYKRRSVGSAINMARTMAEGYKNNDIPFVYYPITVKPIISALLPSRLMKNYHQFVDGRHKTL